MFLNSVCDDDDEAGKDNKIVERFYFVFISFLFRFYFVFWRFYFVFISFLFLFRFYFAFLFSNPCALSICDDDEITKLESDLKHEVSLGNWEAVNEGINDEWEGYKSGFLLRVTFSFGVVVYLANVFVYLFAWFLFFLFLFVFLTPAFRCLTVQRRVRQM